MVGEERVKIWSSKYFVVVVGILGFSMKGISEMKIKQHPQLHPLSVSYQPSISEYIVCWKKFQFWHFCGTKVSEMIIILFV